MSALPVYYVKVQSHRGTFITGKYSSKSEAAFEMGKEARVAVVTTEKGRILATNVARSF